MSTVTPRNPALVADLLPGRTLVETHISWVFLGEETVWKVKKPVDFGFLDFYTPDRRRAACRTEVKLNRRLAAGVYLGCVPITLDPRGHHRFGGDGEPVDWAVEMVRLAETARADTLLRQGELRGAQLDRIAARLARFHDEARHDADTARFGSVEAVATNVEENFTQTRDHLLSYLEPEQAEELESWQRGFLEHHADLFASRQAAGRVRDGHGDLRLEHVYLPQSPGEDGETSVVIVDCIEFNDRFRYADVCADVAFLAMDLTWHGHPGLAERFLAAYAREANDFDLYPVVDFYESYRAFVRGKIASFGVASGQLAYRERLRLEEQARRYFLLALASERRTLETPRLVAVGGLIASGKSTVAAQLAAELEAPVIEADRTRKYLARVEPTTPLDDPAWQGAYSPGRTAEVYGELLRRAGVVLSSGRTAILDASFRSREHRQAARRLAQEHGVDFLFIECRADLETCRKRLRERALDRGVSDGRLEIFEEFAARWQPVNELPAAEHCPLDTTQPLVANLQLLRAKYLG